MAQLFCRFSTAIEIVDQRIAETVDAALKGGIFWPEPLLQLNPTFLPGGTIDKLVAEGILHPECAKIFRIEKSPSDHAGKLLLLHTHQREAILKAVVRTRKTDALCLSLALCAAPVSIAVTEFFLAASLIFRLIAIILNRRFSRSIQAQVAYTWSRCTDDGAFGVGSFNGSAVTPSAIENLFNQAIDHGSCSFDIIQVLRVNGLVALPFRGNRLVEGWQISGILNTYGGIPINVNTGFDRAGFTSGNTPRPNYVGGCDPYSGARTVSHWFNTSCYQLEPVGTFGNTGRNTLRGPRFFNTDISLSKDTKLTEQFRLQFRAEVFNIFNHENFANPNNNVFSASGAVNAAAGVITSSNFGTTPRQIQFGLKFTF